MDELKTQKRRSFWKGALAGVLIAGILLTMVFVILFLEQAQKISGFAKDYESALQYASNSGSVSSGQVITDEVVKKVDLIYNKIISQFYFESDVDVENMRESIYRGIIDSLGDKYAEYYTAEELIDLFTESEGVYYGIGSYVSMDAVTGYPLLTGVFKDSPASKAGLRDGDIIYKVNGEDVYGLTLTEVTGIIKGPENTPVDLTIVRNGESDYISVTVIRGKVESPTVVYEMKHDGVGYIQITEFDDITTGQFEAAYKDLNGQKMKALIIDLRSNGGGNLDTVVDIASQILPSGVITYTEDKNGHRETFSSKGDTPIKVPLAVLTNEYTASASELLSGAIRDYGLGVLIGTNTYGKGIVQTIYPLSDGSGVKYTTSRYFTPSGVCIHGAGLAPDIEIEFDGERYYSSEAYDNQLEYAIDYLLEKLNEKN